MKRVISILLVAIMMVSLFAVNGFAGASDYSLTGAEISAADIKDADGTVEIPLVYATDATFFSLEGTWTADAPLTLSALTAGGTASPMENDPATGRVVWTDMTFTGFDVAAGGVIWTATVTVPAGTAAGEYSVKLHIDSVTGAVGSEDLDDSGIDLTAVVKVTETPDDITYTKVEAKAATCTEAGNIEYYAGSDGKYYDAEGGNEITLESTVVEALGHDWGEWVVTKEPTTTEKGERTRTCSRCGATESEEIDPIPEGMTKVEAKAATCTEPGNIEYYKDAATGKLYKDVEGKEEITEAETVIPALGHNWSVWMQQTDGSYVRTCSVCGKTETTTYDPEPTPGPTPGPLPPVIIPTTYTLSFETNGGSAVAAVTGNANQEVFLATYVPTYEGKTFAGWFSDAELTTMVEKVELKSNTTVYAGWLPFSDIPEDAWYLSEITQLLPLGLVDGVESCEFKADDETARGMIVTTLYKLAGSPEVSGEMVFEDVAEGSYYYNAVLWAVQNGIAKGYGDGTFKPEQSVSRQELVCFLYRYATLKGIDVSGKADLAAIYTDANQVAFWAAEEMAWGVDAGLVKGMSDTVLQPAGTGTHAQWAALLVRVAALGK